MSQRVRTYLLTLTLGVVGVTTGVFAFNGLALAAAAGQIEGGDIYRVRNVTKNTDFTDPASADKCETVQYRVRLHNPGPDPVTNVNVKATLPATAGTSHSSTVTISGANMNPATTSDTAALTLSESLKISYVPGTTQLLDANGGVLNTLPDTIFTSGVNVGTVGVSVQQKRFVQFQAKVDCPQPPQPQPSTGQCKMLTLTVTNKDQREVSAKVDGETNNATITGYSINFGDGAVVNQQTATHKYDRDGTFTVVGSVTVKFADGHSETKTAEACKASVTFKEKQPPVVTPPTTVVVGGQGGGTTVVTTPGGSTTTSTSSTTVAAAPAGLPNVGPGSVAGLAGLSTITTVLGSVFYRWQLLRRSQSE
jgi:uncharacterized repeat protein (TIGR01451 family)